MSVKSLAAIPPSVDADIATSVARVLTDLVDRVERSTTSLAIPMSLLLDGYSPISTVTPTRASLEPASIPAEREQFYLDLSRLAAASYPFPRVGGDSSHRYFRITPPGSFVYSPGFIYPTPEEIPDRRISYGREEFERLSLRDFSREVAELVRSLKESLHGDHSDASASMPQSTVSGVDEVD